MNKIMSFAVGLELTMDFIPHTGKTFCRLRTGYIITQSTHL